MTVAIDFDALDYRPLGDDELSGIVELYDLAGWGPVTDEWVDETFFKGPYGRGLLMGIIGPGGRVLGAMGVRPVQVLAYGEIVLGARGRGVVLAPEVRRSERGVFEIDENDPLHRMGQAAKPVVADLGWKVSYGLPAPSMQRRREASSVDPIGTVDTWRVPGLKVPLLDVAPKPTRLTASIVESFGSEYDELWERARRGLGITCAVVRDRVGLSFLRKDDTIVECRDENDDLAGYATLFVSPSAEGRLLDVLAIDHHTLADVVDAVINAARADNDAYPLTFMSTVAHPWYEEALRRAGADDIEDWPFEWTVATQDEPPAVPIVARDWYFTTGD